MREKKERVARGAYKGFASTPEGDPRFIASTGEGSCILHHTIRTPSDVLSGGAAGQGVCGLTSGLKSLSASVGLRKGAVRWLHKQSHTQSRAESRTQSRRQSYTQSSTHAEDRSSTHDPCKMVPQMTAPAAQGSACNVLTVWEHIQWHDGSLAEAQCSIQPPGQEEKHTNGQDCTWCPPLVWPPCAPEHDRLLATLFQLLLQLLHSCTANPKRHKGTKEDGPEGGRTQVVTWP